MPESYSRLLIAHYIPMKQCYVDQNAVLTVSPLRRIPLKPYIEHHFVSISDRKTKSRYGWVKKVKPFSVDDFVSEYLGGAKQTPDEYEHLQIMFRAIAQLPAGTPVSAEYNRRGSETRRMTFVIHRILFYQP